MYNSFKVTKKGAVSMKRLGRPLIGVTKKVSLTLSDDLWKEFDRDAESVGGRSAFLRYLVEEYYDFRERERQIAIDLYGEDCVF